MKYFEIFANDIGISHFIAVHSHYFFTVFYFLGTLHKKNQHEFSYTELKRTKKSKQLTILAVLEACTSFLVISQQN